MREARYLDGGRSLPLSEKEERTSDPWRILKAA